MHSIWAKAVALRCAMWVERVPTEVNLADDPSRWEHHHLCASCDQCMTRREDYRLLNALKPRQAERVEALLDDEFMSPVAWTPHY